MSDFSPMGEAVPSFKIALENVINCGGTCSGCMLSDDEKKSLEGSWTDGEYDAAMGFVGRLLDANAGPVREPDSVTLLIGQGDHCTMPVERIVRIVEGLPPVSQGKAVTILTGSAIGKPSLMIPKLEAVYEASRRINESVFFAVVFDPVKSLHKSFADAYAENISAMRDIFGAIDFTGNLGPDFVQCMKPAEMHEFLLTNGFRNIELNLVPTMFSAQMFSRHWDEIVDWVVEFNDIWTADGRHEVHYGTLLMRYIDLIERAGQESDSLRRLIAANLRREIYIDHDGNVSFMQAGGTGNTIPFVSRFGYKPIGNIHNEGLVTRIDRLAEMSAIKIVNEVTLAEACAECSERELCAMSGATVLRKMMRPLLTEKDGCPIRFREVFASARRKRAEFPNYKSIFGDLVLDKDGVFAPYSGGTHERVQFR